MAKMPVAKTSAERQAAYKARADEKGERRLDVWVSEETMQALERLAQHYSKTKRQLLEDLVSQQDAKVISKLGPTSKEGRVYLGVTRKQ
jgi:hypothetical protein